MWGGGHTWNRAVKMSRLHKDQLCKSGALQHLSQPLTLLSPPLMEEAEAGAVERVGHYGLPAFVEGD